jgi:hypothetical protein
MDPNIQQPQQNQPVQPQPSVVQSPPVTNPVQNTLPPQQPIGNGLNKKYLIAGVIVTLLILVGLSVLFLTRNSSKNNPMTEAPSEMDKKLVTVGDKDIYKSEVWRKANEQYSGDAIDNAILNNFLNLMIEREILDREAKELGIGVTENEISTSGGTTSKVVRDNVKYELLKKKIVESQVQSVLAYTLGYWIRPLSDPYQPPEFAQRRTDGASALIEAQSAINRGEAPVDVAKSIYEKYESLKPIWALNGFIVDRIEDESVYANPKLFTFNKEELEAMNDPEIYNAMAAMESGEVRRVVRSDGSGGAVIKVMEKTVGEFGDYEMFLSTRKKELVTVHDEI